MLPFAIQKMFWCMSSHLFVICLNASDTDTLLSKTFIVQMNSNLVHSFPPLIQSFLFYGKVSDPSGAEFVLIDRYRSFHSSTGSHPIWWTPKRAGLPFCVDSYQALQILFSLNHHACFHSCNILDLLLFLYTTTWKLGLDNLTIWFLNYPELFSLYWGYTDLPGKGKIE